MEDADLPENLEDEQVFLRCREQHEEQKKATLEHEKRAKRTLELMALKDEIIETREKAKQMEWKAEMCEGERIGEKQLDFDAQKKGTGNSEGTRGTSSPI